MEKEVIWKFEIEISDKCVLTMPAHCEILSVGVQKVGFTPRGTPDERAFIWVKVNPYNKGVKRCFVTYGTGHSIETKEDTHLSFIGTYQFESGFVGHIFEIF